MIFIYLEQKNPQLIALRLVEHTPGWSARAMKVWSGDSVWSWPIPPCTVFISFLATVNSASLFHYTLPS